MHRGAHLRRRGASSSYEASGAHAAAQLQEESHAQLGPQAQPAWPQAAADWQPQVQEAPMQDVQVQVVSV